MPSNKWGNGTPFRQGQSKQAMILQKCNHIDTVWTVISQTCNFWLCQGNNQANVGHSAGWRTEKTSSGAWKLLTLGLGHTYPRPGGSTAVWGQ